VATAREVRVSTDDDYGRSFMTLAVHTSGFTVGGVVNGLNGTVTLRLNGGFDLPITAPGGFQFGTALANGTTYSVSVASQPGNGQVCGPGVGNGSGTISGANVTNLVLTCANYSVGGTVSGLTGSGLVLRINGANDLAVAPSSTSFTFPPGVLGGGIFYNVMVGAQPMGQTCTVVRPWGLVVAAVPTITHISLACVDNVTDALSGTYRLTVLRGEPVSDFRAFLSFNAEGTYIFGLHEEDPECGVTGQGGLEYGVYRWNQASNSFAFVNAVIDTNGNCGVTDSGVPHSAGTLTRNPDGTLSTVIPADDGVSPPSTATFTPVASTPGSLIGAFGTSQFFNVYGADDTIFVADIRSNHLVPATTPGIEDGCYLLSGTLAAGSYTTNVGNTCAVSATQTGADTNGVPWGLSQFGTTGVWQFTVTNGGAQFTLPGATVSAELPRIVPN
jgi:hypothetical protein